MNGNEGRAAPITKMGENPSRYLSAGCKLAKAVQV